MNDEKTHIGQRLWQERTRLGLTQTDMAKRGGVVMRTYADYESGRSSPKAENLQQWAACGVDILFVVTGHATDSMLSPDEMMVLNYWRDSPDELRAAWLGFYRAYGQAIRHEL